ncbi:MAG: hypothetical protein WKG07_10390 [Hymenobacter sp.]
MPAACLPHPTGHRHPAAPPTAATDLTSIHPKVTLIFQTSVFKFSSLAELEEYYTAPDHAGRYGYRGLSTQL